MSEKHGWGKTVLGWIVVKDEDGGPAGKDSDADAADALIQQYAKGPEPMPVKLDGPLPQVKNGAVDFAKVYRAAGIAPEEMDRAGKALNLIGSLPQDTPAATRKQIVEASLKAFGVPTDKIIEASAQELQALEAFVRAGQSDVQKVIGEGNSRIDSLQKEMAQVKQAMEQAVADQTERTRITNTEKLKIQELLEFFGQAAVAKVVEDSPKLHSPQQLQTTK
ncbi:MAG: hypothetical protein ACLQIB_17515 [Isosphaeraceae bacterium]